MYDTPIFSGFPQAGIDFLADLAAHNERTWFEAHKEAYRSLLLELAQAFVFWLGKKLQTLAPDIHIDTCTDGAGVLMRIHRDTVLARISLLTKQALVDFFGKVGRRKPRVQRSVSRSKRLVWI